jgi:hypothetical protein
MLDHETLAKYTHKKKIAEYTRGSMLPIETINLAV